MGWTRWDFSSRRFWPLDIIVPMNTTPGTRPTPRRRSPLVVGCLAAPWLIWGSTYRAIRFALVGFPPYFLMATRFVCAGALLMGWQLARGGVRPNATEGRNGLSVGTLMLGGGMG